MKSTRVVALGCLLLLCALFADRFVAGAEAQVTTVRHPRPAVLAELRHDRSAVIEASAGTGKTWTLEHLIIDLLLGDLLLGASATILIRKAFILCCATQVARWLRWVDCI